MDLNRKPNQGAASTGSSSGAGPDPTTISDWRSQLPPDTRQRMLNQIIDTLKRHLAVPVPEGLNELKKTAVRFEEKIYNSATSEPDYVEKVSLKMISMETKMQPGMNPPLSDPLGVGMMSQKPGQNPSQSIAMLRSMNQPPASRQQEKQPLLQVRPNMPSSVGCGPSGTTIPPMSRPSMSNSNPMSVHGGTSGPGGPTGPFLRDMYLDTQRRQPSEQFISQNQMLYQQQLAMRQKQQQTQMHMSSALAGGSGMMSVVPTGGMQQTQMNPVQQQPVRQGNQQQPLMRKQQQQPQPQLTMQDSTIPMQQTNNVTDLQQKQLQMQLNQMHQNQLQLNQMKQSLTVNQQMLQDQQHFLSQFQSQQQQMPQQQLQQQQPSMMLQQKMQGSPALLQMQNSNAIDLQREQQLQFIPQQQQPPQQQRVLQDVASSTASMDSTAQRGHAVDFQEEIYQRIKYLNDTYFNDLREIHQKLSMKLSHVDSIVPPNARGSEQIERMKNFKTVLERMMAVLQLGKHSIHIGLKDKISLYEKQILNILQNNKKAPQQQPQAEPMRRVKPRLCRVCGTCAHKRRDQ